MVICTNGYSNTQRSAVPWVRNRIVPVCAHQICTDTISDGLMKDVKPSGRAVLDSKTNIFWDRPTPDDKQIIFGARTGHDDGDLRITAKKLRDLMVMVYPQLKDTRISHVWRGVPLPRRLVNAGDLAQGLHGHVLDLRRRIVEQTQQIIDRSAVVEVAQRHDAGDADADEHVVESPARTAQGVSALLGS